MPLTIHFPTTVNALRPFLTPIEIDEKQKDGLLPIFYANGP